MVIKLYKKYIKKELCCYSNMCFSTRQIGSNYCNDHVFSITDTKNPICVVEDCKNKSRTDTNLPPKYMYLCSYIIGLCVSHHSLALKSGGLKISILNTPNSFLVFLSIVKNNITKYKDNYNGGLK